MSHAITLTSDITVRPVQSMGGDHMVVAAAKVSTSGEEALKFAEIENAEGNEGLINYLMKQRHGSPFESSAMTFFVHAPIFVWREWHRHRIGFSYNEESARYKQLDPVFWVPRRDRAMIPADDYKAARPKFLTIDDAMELSLHDALPPDGMRFLKKQADTKHEQIVARMGVVYETAYDHYSRLINEGIANEVARAVLPVGIYSSCWVTTNPRALMHFLSLRTHEPEASFVSYPQAEIEEAARACEEFLKSGWPLTHKAFVKNGRVAP